MKKFIKVFLIACAVFFAAPNLYAQVSVSLTVRTAPPALPVYVQPECPADGYIWQPGYWAYDDDEDGYYWVPGVWVAPPNPGVYWTPAYWGYSGGFYGFHVGYWGPHVGFYGGINYGYGYSGYGYGGGRWEGNQFRYNTAVVNVNRTIIHNTYIDRTVIVNNNDRRSFNGGRGGVNARPRPQDRVAMRDRHIQPTPSQISHQQAARSDRSSFAKVNHGRPTVAAVSRPGDRKDARPAVARPDNRARADKSNAARPARNQRGEPAQRAARPAAGAGERARPQQRTESRQRAVQPRVAPRRTEQPRVQPQRAPQPRVEPQRAPVQRAAPPQRAPVQRAAPPQRAPVQRAAPPQRAPAQHAPQARPEHHR